MTRSGKSYSITGDEDIRKLVADLVRNHIVNEHDPQKKSFYRAMAVRIFKGYRLEVLKEYKNAVTKACENTDKINIRRIDKKRKKGLNNGI